MESGPYAGLLATWHYIVEVEKKKKICNDSEKSIMLSMVLSELTIIRKAFYDFIVINSNNKDKSISLINNASPKLKQLIQILSTIKRQDICLVFVDRRTTAKVLYHFLKVTC